MINLTTENLNYLEITIYQKYTINGKINIARQSAL